jgi:uncharacterized protein
MQGMKRSYAGLLAEYLEHFPCVAVIGPRQCGKTTLISQLPSPWRHFDLEKRNDYEAIEQDPDLFLRLHPEFCALDEAQLLPELFSALRVAIDQQRDQKGRFVITGSSSPELLTALSESLAGRVGIIEMAPFSYRELQGVSSKWVKLLKSGRFEKEFESLLPQGSLNDVQKHWFKGGYPEPFLSNDSRFFELWMDQYIKTYIEQDIRRLYPNLQLQRFRRFIGMLAGVSGEILNLSELARSLDVSQPTVKDYLSIVEHTFLWRSLPAFDRDPRKRIIKHPRGHLRDSGLLHFLLRIPNDQSLLSHPKMGRFWESYVIEEIHRELHSQGVSFHSFFYRTSSGAEVDLVLEGAFGLIPIEIKFSQSIEKRGLRALKDFIEEYRSPFGLVINQSERPLRLTENIYQIAYLNL